MRIDVKKILSLPVYTEVGLKLGFIKNIEIDLDSHHILTYIVESGFLNTRVFYITPLQIKKITNTEIVVDDTVEKNIIKKKAGISSVTASSSIGAAMNQ